jgi:hypothetical protein
VSARVAAILAVLLWTSAFAMLALGLTIGPLHILRWAAIPDAVGALFFTWWTARKWVHGGGR